MVSRCLFGLRLAIEAAAYHITCGSKLPLHNDAVTMHADVQKLRLVVGTGILSIVDAFGGLRPAFTDQQGRDRRRQVVH